MFYVEGTADAKSSRTKRRALHVPFTCCAFAAVDDDTSNPEIAAMPNSIVAPVLTYPSALVKPALRSWLIFAAGTGSR